MVSRWSSFIEKRYFTLNPWGTTDTLNPWRSPTPKPAEVWWRTLWCGSCSRTLRTSSTSPSADCQARYSGVALRIASEEPLGHVHHSELVLKRLFFKKHIFCDIFMELSNKYWDFCWLKSKLELQQLWNTHPLVNKPQGYQSRAHGNRNWLKTKVANGE